MSDTAAKSEVPVTANPNSVVTSATPAVKSSMTGAIRITFALIVAIALGIFILIWDGKFINGYNLPDWLGPFAIYPFIAVVLGFGTNCLIQYLSCKQVQWLVQLQRIAFVPIPSLLLWGLLYIFPSMRWPIEGLVQEHTPDYRRGLSSGFYGFWMGLYTQSILNGMAQVCPTL